VTRLSLSVRIGAGFVLGLAFGLLAAFSGSARLVAAATGVEPIGTIWINAIRMCVVPLVAAALVSGVGGIGEMRTLGRVGVRTFGFIFATLLIAGLIGLVLALFTVRLSPVSPEMAESLRAAARAGAEEVTAQTQRIQGIRQFLVDLVPSNPVQAAANGALLPLIVFSVLFGAATGTLAEGPRRAILGFCDAVVAALIRLIGWVMEVAPIGVLCLAAPVAARFGVETLRNLLVFVVTVVVACAIVAVAIYGSAARTLARVQPGPFARTITPATAVAFTTASSMAALPTMMDTALNRLRMSNAVASFVLPLGATLNRPGSAVYQAVATVFVASLYGVPLGPGQLAAAFLASFLMTFSVASIPSATVFTTAPVLQAAGLPIEAIALLLGVDRVPDMFRTALNTIGHQTAAAVVARGEGEVLG
jgi:Na+/H+-dicarboxylate symporter